MREQMLEVGSKGILTILGGLGREWDICGRQLSTEWAGRASVAVMCISVTIDPAEGDVDAKHGRQPGSQPRRQRSRYGRQGGRAFMCGEIPKNYQK